MGGKKARSRLMVSFYQTGTRSAFLFPDEILTNFYRFDTVSFSALAGVFLSPRDAGKWIFARRAAGGCAPRLASRLSLGEQPEAVTARRALGSVWDSRDTGEWIFARRAAGGCAPRLASRLSLGEQPEAATSRLASRLSLGPLAARERFAAPEVSMGPREARKRISAWRAAGGCDSATCVQAQPGAQPGAIHRV